MAASSIALTSLGKFSPKKSLRRPNSVSLSFAGIHARGPLVAQLSAGVTAKSVESPVFLVAGGIGRAIDLGPGKFGCKVLGKDAEEISNEATTERKGKKKKGIMITIESVFGMAGQVFYSTANAGVIVIAKSVAKELSFRKFHANYFAPVTIASDETAKLEEDTEIQILGGSYDELLDIMELELLLYH